MGIMDCKDPKHSCAFNPVRCCLVGILGLAAQSCVEPLFWAKPGAEPGEFGRNVIECREELGLSTHSKAERGFSVLNPSVGTDSVAVEQCLAKKGWYLTRKPEP